MYAHWHMKIFFVVSLAAWKSRQQIWPVIPGCVISLPASLLLHLHRGDLGDNLFRFLKDCIYSLQVFSLVTLALYVEFHLSSRRTCWGLGSERFWKQGKPRVLASVGIYILSEASVFCRVSECGCDADLHLLFLWFKSRCASLCHGGLLA